MSTAAEMAKIISIETSTDLCSVALSDNDRLLAYRESRTPRAHASLTGLFIKEILDEQGLAVSDCDAVCVSKGPGSYTGLRVGVSTAKGLCFGGRIPLLAVGSLDVLVWQAIDGKLLPEGCKYIIPVIDARRMEAYTAVFTSDGRQVRETAPEIFTPESFIRYISEGPVLFIGDAAEKCSEVIPAGNAVFCQCHPKASSMLTPALSAYNEKRFEDVAYFEPFYLKEFVATVSKKGFGPV